MSRLKCYTNGSWSYFCLYLECSAKTIDGLDFTTAPSFFQKWTKLLHPIGSWWHRPPLWRVRFICGSITLRMGTGTRRWSDGGPLSSGGQPRTQISHCRLLHPCRCFLYFSELILSHAKTSLYVINIQVWTKKVYNFFLRFVLGSTRKAKRFHLEICIWKHFLCVAGSDCIKCVAQKTVAVEIPNACKQRSWIIQSLSLYFLLQSADTPGVCLNFFEPGNVGSYSW